MLSRRVLMSGSKLVSLWLGDEPDPLDSPYSDMHNKNNMLLQVSFKERVVFVSVGVCFCLPLHSIQSFHRLITGYWMGRGTDHWVASE